MKRCVLMVLSVLSSAAVADMITLPAGKAQIGNEAGHPDEKPVFKVSVTAFELDRGPVQVRDFARYVEENDVRTEAETLGSAAVMTYGTGQWQLVEGANWRHPQGPQAGPAPEDHPVTQVSWNDAHAYCAAQGKRLPSEVEFEYAARLAGHGDQHAFGRRLVKDGRYQANVWTGVFPVINSEDDGYKSTSPVGVFGRDGLGFEDLAGNVWEWTADWYQAYPPAAGGPQTEKVQRGGSFLCDPNVCYGFRVSARAHATPDSSLMHVGFRCARDLKD